MQSSFPNHVDPQTTDFHGNPIFSVVLAYEDFETGKHAKKTYDFLAETLGNEYRLTNQMWKFDVLGIPKLREIATKDALMADIIIISCRGGAQLPPHVRKWVEGWSEVKGNAIGLVALFDCTAEQSKPIRHLLAEVAKKCDVEFFAQTDDAIVAVDIEQPVTTFQRASQPGASALNAIPHIMNRGFTSPRWGLNE